MSIHSERFNRLPFRQRDQLSGILIETQLNQLLRERNRLTGSYNKNLREIDAHIKSLKKGLEEIEARDDLDG